MAAGASIHENWFYAPFVCNSRVSSVVPSPHPVRRPRGVYYGADGGKPVYGPSRELDYELEMSVFVSKPVGLGSELDIADVEEHIFGFVLLNDWSSRDLQVMEMKPLGPFHGKNNFCSHLDGCSTDCSLTRLWHLHPPWVVTLEALEPFRCPPKTEQHPAPFDHLRWPGSDGTFDIRLQVDLIRKSGVLLPCTYAMVTNRHTPRSQATA